MAAVIGPGVARDEGGDRCAGGRDVRLVNGTIHTLDAGNSIVSSVTIRNGRFAEVGREAQADDGPCMRTINLNGRTAVPGLVDNHNHFLLLGLRPGHDTRLETAASIADVQAAIRARTKTVKPGEFITAMGGWNPAQFAENRLPTLAELDAYEDTGPAGEPPALFLRTETVATREDCTEFPTWVYVYNRPVSECRRIQSGDYLDEPSAAQCNR